MTYILAQITASNDVTAGGNLIGIPMLFAGIFITIQIILLLGSLRHLVIAARAFLLARTPLEPKV